MVYEFLVLHSLFAQKIIAGAPMSLLWFHRDDRIEQDGEVGASIYSARVLTEEAR